MSNLVSVPYQPGYKGTPDTVAMLMRACQIAGHDITLTDAWRSYAEQSYYWDQYQNHGGNIASNPDTGQRNHMRGAAFDILNTSSVNRNAMLQAGFTPDPDESWHFNNPNWQNMPIIPTDDPGTSTSAPSQQEEEEMSDLSFVPDAQSTTIWLVSLTTGKRVGIPSPYQMTVCQRTIANRGGDKMLAAEIDTIFAPLVTILNSGLWSAAASLPTLDTAKLASAVLDALKAAKITTVADPASLVAPLDAAFARSLTAIAKTTSEATTKAVGFDQAKLSSSIADALADKGVVAKVDQATVENAVSAAISRALQAIAKASDPVQAS